MPACSSETVCSGFWGMAAIASNCVSKSSLKKRFEQCAT
jgi:hypothetical protein